MDQTSAATETPNFSGWLPDRWDGADHEYKRPAGVQDQEPVNLRKKYPDYWDYPYDQYTLGSCVANAVAAAYRYESKKLAAEQKLKYENNPSRTFIYWNARAAGDPEVEPIISKEGVKEKKFKFEDKGTYNRTALKGLHKFGTCAEEHWPYCPSKEEYKEAYALYKAQNPGDMPDKDWNKKKYAEWVKFCTKMSDKCNDEPLKAAAKYALHNRIAGYERLDVQRTNDEVEKLSKSDPKGERGLDGEKVVKNMRVALSDGHPVVFGFLYYAKDPFVFDPETKRKKLMKLPGRHVKPKPDPANPKKDPVGHAVLAVGYDDDNVLCQTSWGANWGPEEKEGIRDGLFLMPWSYVSDFVATQDFWIIKTLRPSYDVDDEDRKDAQAAEEEKAREKARAEALQAARKPAGGGGIK